MLEHAISEARRNSDPPPHSEADTCNWIIYPLLLAFGYGHREIRAQGTQSTGQYPDYTILYAEPEFTWHLEAKAWNVALQEVHAQQALNYANTAGTRWVVLTNGRKWQLYDNKVFGKAPEKLVCSADLMDESFIAFGHAISRASLMSGHIERFVRNQRLYECLSSELSTPSSPLVKAMVKNLQQRPGLGDLQGKEIVAYFSTSPTSASNEAPVSSSDYGGPEVEPIEAKEDSLVGGVVFGSGSGKVLSSLRAEDVTHRKPLSISIRGQIMQLKTWKDLLLEAIGFCSRQGLNVPLPIFQGRAKSPFIAVSTEREKFDFREPVLSKLGPQDIVVETHYSAISLVQTTWTLLARVGIQAEEVLLELSERSRS